MDNKRTLRDSRTFKNEKTNNIENYNLIKKLRSETVNLHLKLQNLSRNKWGTDFLSYINYY